MSTPDAERVLSLFIQNTDYYGPSKKADEARVALQDLLTQRNELITALETIMLPENVGRFEQQIARAVLAKVRP